MEIGIFTFVPRETGDGPADDARTMRQLVEQAVLADEVGLDVVGVGEHHRRDFVVSAPAIALAAIAARTERVRLTSAVSVLSSDDPVRIYQDFATIDLLSNGRAEIMAGRGSFIESFPLFGYDLGDYDTLFAEKLDLLLRVRAGEIVRWEGSHRPPIEDRGVYPRALQQPLPVWLAAGGNPGSAVRAGTLGLPMALAIIGGMPERFAPFVETHREAAHRAGHGRLPLGINSHGFIADTSQAAIDESYLPTSIAMNRIGRERGWSPMGRAEYEASAGLRGANFVGSPDQVIEKVLFQHSLFGHDRFLLQLAIGAMPHEKVMHAIELLGTKVAPVVRDEIARRGAAQESPGL